MQSLQAAEPGQAEQLRALYHLAVELSRLTSLESVLETALRHCLDLTGSQFGFIGLNVAEGDAMDVAAVLGFHPSPAFYAEHRVIPLRPNLFATAVLENRPVRSKDATSDGRRVGQPAGHPPVATFLGVPLRLHDEPIGMIGVANRRSPYDADHERLILTYAAQVAIVIRNAQLYEQLATANEELETTVLARTRELHAAKEALAAKATALQKALAEIVDLQEVERKRIAQDIHDGINQLLIGALLSVKSGQARLAMADATGAAEAFEDAQSVLRQVEVEVRRVVYDLHPPNLEELGLPAAIRRLGERFESFFEVPCAVTIEGRPARLSGELEIAIYRIVQEALHNAGSHAAATRSAVRLTFGDEDVVVDVTDDGIGFQPDLAQGKSYGHFGLRGMRDRAEGRGGSLVVQSAPNAGTTIAARIPVAQ